jgi:hypothetical protein
MNLSLLEQKIDALRRGARCPDEIARWLVTEQPLLRDVLHELALDKDNSGHLIHASIPTEQAYYALETVLREPRPCMEGVLFLKTTGLLELDPVFSLPCWGGEVSPHGGTPCANPLTETSWTDYEYGLSLSAHKWPFVAPYVLHQYRVSPGAHQVTSEELIARHYPSLALDTFNSIVQAGLAPGAPDEFAEWLEPYRAAEATHEPLTDLPTGLSSHA